MEKWANLPDHLLQLIVEKGLTDELDVRRLRAVCSPWRSSIKSPTKSLPLHHLPLLCSPASTDPALHDARFALSYDTVYLLQPPQSPSSCWLVRVKEENPSRFSLLNPVTKQQINYFPETLPRTLDMLDFNVYQVTKVFHLRVVSPLDVAENYLRYNYDQSNVFDLWKVVVLNNLILAINRKYDLCFLKLGDLEWTIVHHTDETPYKDIAVRDENFYAIDDKGIVSVFDQSFSLIKTIPPASSDQENRYYNQLVTSLDELLLVCRRNISRFTSVVDYNHETKCYVSHNGSSFKAEVDIYRLVEEDFSWEKVDDLGDRVLFVSNKSCYSVSVRDFRGYRANCIYFGNQWSSNIYLRYGERLRGLDHQEIAVFNMEDGSGGPLEAFPGFEDLFWPPPTWLSGDDTLGVAPETVGSPGPIIWLCKS